MDPNLIPDRGGWHSSHSDPRVHLTMQNIDTGQHQHMYLEPGDPVRMLGRAALGGALGGPNV